MSLKDRFQAIAIKMINSSNAFLSVSQPVTFSQPIYQQYDEESGMIFTSSNDVTINAIVGPWQDDRTRAENSDAIQTEDLKCIIAFLEMPLDLRIGNDIVTLPDGTTYNIIRKDTDAAEASITLRLAKVLEP